MIEDALSRVLSLKAEHISCFRFIPAGQRQNAIDLIRNEEKVADYLSYSAKNINPLGSDNDWVINQLLCNRIQELSIMNGVCSKYMAFFINFDEIDCQQVQTLKKIRRSVQILNKLSKDPPFFCLGTKEKKWILGIRYALALGCMGVVNKRDFNLAYVPQHIKIGLMASFKAACLDSDLISEMMGCLDRIVEDKNVPRITITTKKAIASAEREPGDSIEVDFLTVTHHRKVRVLLIN